MKAKAKVNCHQCGKEIEKQLIAGLDKYSCDECKKLNQKTWREKNPKKK